jgi:precorrin-2 dehydrogenase / sirohydrochlorin ferrochelatase
MNSRWYPIFLSVKSLPCLVVGGGAVATRKAETLLKAGASVCVVSPQVSTDLKKLSKKTLIRWIAKPYAPRYLRGMRLVIAATDNPSVNHRIFADAEKLGVLANVVDDLDYCRFIAPAQCSGGSLEIAVTTGGEAPIIAKRVRDEIARTIVKRYAPIVAVLGKRRKRIKKLVSPAKAQFWQNVQKLVSGPDKNIGLLTRKIDAALAAAQSRKP